MPNCMTSLGDATSHLRARAGELRGPQAIQARLQSPASLSCLRSAIEHNAQSYGQQRYQQANRTRNNKW